MSMDDIKCYKRPRRRRDNMPCMNIPLTEADDFINAFFEGEGVYIDAFKRICEHMVGLDNEVLVRVYPNIIGAAKPDEHSRFYVIFKNGLYHIKYKNVQKRQIFEVLDLERYFAYNEKSIAFFAENREIVLLKQEENADDEPPCDNRGEENSGTQAEASHDIQIEAPCDIQVDESCDIQSDELYYIPIDSLDGVEEEEYWADLRSVCQSSIESGSYKSASRERVDELYAKLTDFFDGMCSDKNIMNERETDIIRNRIINPSAMTLNELGKRYGISRERVRQLENRRWRFVELRILRFKRQINLQYKEKLKQLLEEIPEEVLVSAVLQIRARNDKIGLLIKKICIPKHLGNDDRIKQSAKLSEPVHVAIMRDAGIYYHSQLMCNPKADSAIEFLRLYGLNDGDMVNLGLGFHDVSLTCCINYLTKQLKYQPSDMDRAQLVWRNEDGRLRDKMRNSIIIPTVDTERRVVCFDFFELKKRLWFKYNNTDTFVRSHNLYSLNLAIRDGKKSVFVVTSYNDYFKLVGKGIKNAVSTYHSGISTEQLELLKRYFKVIIVLAESNADFSKCQDFCAQNDMYCERVGLDGCRWVAEYIDKREDWLKRRVTEYESVFADK